MTVINSFYRNPNALAYATQLFAPSSSLRADQGAPSVWAAPEDSGFTETAGQRALARIESLEHMVEAVVALCCGGPELTGRNATSHEIIDELGLAVRSLEGT